MLLSPPVLWSFMFANAVINSDNVEALSVSSARCCGGKEGLQHNCEIICRWLLGNPDGQQICHPFPATISSEPCVQVSVAIVLILRVSPHIAEIYEFASSKFSAFLHPMSSCALASMIASVATDENANYPDKSSHRSNLHVTRHRPDCET